METERITRRQALEKIASLGAAALGSGMLGAGALDFNSQILNAAERDVTSKKSKDSEEKDEYTAIGQRLVEKFGIDIIHSAFLIKTKVWNNLPKKLTKQQFYDIVKESPIKNTTRTILEGVVGIHPGPLNSEDIQKEFMKNAAKFIKAEPYELDPQLKFTEKDKKLLEYLLKTQLKSPVIGKINPLFGKEREVYLFPPKSLISLVAGDSNPKIEIAVNTNKDYDQPPTYKIVPSKAIADSDKKRVFETFLRFAILTEDPETQGYDKEKIKAPIDNFYHNSYKNRKDS